LEPGKFRLELGALEERRLRLAVNPRARVGPDDYLVVHLFHLSGDGGTFHGRLTLLLVNDIAPLALPA
jgi:hypothetical protein